MSVFVLRYFSTLLSYRLSDFCLICFSTVNCLLLANNYYVHLHVSSSITYNTHANFRVQYDFYLCLLLLLLLLVRLVTQKIQFAE